MSDQLQKSWSAFPEDVARRYLKSFGHPSQDSKLILYEILEEMKLPDLRLLDLGCGNANLAEYFAGKKLKFFYTGVDFSDVLLDAAKLAYPLGQFVCDDVNVLGNLSPEYDVAVYSHVMEMLPSPESSLRAASRVAKKIVIRFFEPPADRPDWVELSEMDVGGEMKMPYLRRRMSQDYYELILNKIGCTNVDVYHTMSKDQVHVLHY